jgi:hypothetical protein
MLGVQLAGLFRMVLGVQMVAVRRMGVVRRGFRLFVPVLLGRLAVMVSRLLVMLGGVLVVLRDLVGVAHGGTSSKWRRFFRAAFHTGAALPERGARHDHRMNFAPSGVASVRVDCG